MSVEKEGVGAAAWWRALAEGSKRCGDRDNAFVVVAGKESRNGENR